jgi:hypothetical protein
MKMNRVNRGLMPLALMCCAVPAHAANVVFNGSMTGNSLVVSPNNCGGTQFHTSVPANTTVGTSNLGAFQYSSDVCQGSAGISGIFTIFLADGSFSGTQSGAATPVPPFPPTLFNLLINYTITSGTGAYAGATGSFIGTGTANNGVTPTLLTLSFRAVPEPATWALMLVGFAGIGMALRRSRVRVAMQLA